MTALNRFVYLRALLPAVLAVSVCLGAFAAPTISSFSPNFGAASDPNPVIISGSGFTPGTLVVKFNDVAAVSPLPNGGGTTINVFVPAGAPLGSGPIKVFVNGVEADSADNFTVIGAGPYISGFSPTIGAGGADVTITGAHFTTGMTVRFNGVATVTNAVSPTSFNVKVPNGATSGLISVSNSLGISTSVSNFFVPPVLTSFSPANGRTGTNVVIRGTNFLGATSVLFSNVNAASFVVLSNNAIQATAPAGVTTGPIRVNTQAGSVTSSSNFVVQPTVTGFSPIFGPVGTSVTVTGANFNVGTPVVRFSGVQAAAPSGVSFNQLTAIVPNGAITGPITVSNVDGIGTSPGLFYLPPRITSFSPTNCPPGSTVTLIGTNFTGASAVNFNGTPAASFTVTNNSVIGAVVPNGFTTGPISITTPAGTTNTSSLASSNFFAAPIISNFSPLHGLPGTNVTIFGSSFLGTLFVRFQAAGGGTTNAPIVSVANGQIVVRVPTNAITGPITVVAPAGTNTSVGTFVLDYADLLVTVTDDPDPVTVGSNLVYTILVKNFGPFPSTVTLTNVLPPSVAFLSSTHGTTVSNVTSANLGTINVNATVNVTITATPLTPGLTLTNSTTVVTGPIATLVTNTTFVEPLPLLSVKFNPPSTVQLLWPSSLSNFTLQFKAGLPGTNWSDVLTSPVSSGGTNTVTQTNLGAAMFYRLKR